jgi:predicted amidohydrolase
MIIASAQFGLDALPEPEDFWRRIAFHCEEARSASADAILFPEYFSLSWILASAPSDTTFPQRIRAATAFESEFTGRLRELSSRLSLNIIAGSYPHVRSDGALLNRSYIALAGGGLQWQDKVHLTRFESESWQMTGAEPILHTFLIGSKRCGVAICYDIEFRSYAATAAEAGVDILFVPSCTETEHGYWRVRHCAAARAVENQCFVAQSSVIGGDPRYPDIARHYGQGVILGPCDGVFPALGVIAQGRARQEGLVTARLDFSALADIRRNGTVLNLRDAANAPAIGWR